MDWAGVQSLVAARWPDSELCHRAGFDPAVAAGPFITTLIDISTQTLYLGIASWLLLH